jgi:Winged helix DNA-binding domain
MMPAPPVLSRPQLNRAVLARQLLLERLPAPASGPCPLPEALRLMAGLQAQYAPSMYVGLWSRVAGFERDQLDSALIDRSVVQGSLQRATIHLVDRADYWPIAVAVRQERRKWFLRATRGPTDEHLTAAASVVETALAGGPIRQAEIDRLLGTAAGPRLDRPVGRPANTLAIRNGVGYWLDLVRVPPSGTWGRRRADLYDLAERWIGPPRIDRATATRRLVRSYLIGFGPAAPAQIATWAGLPVTTVNDALAGIRLRRFTDQDDGAELVDLPGLPLPDPDTPAPVRLLGTWDAGLLAHARRGGMLPERHRDRVFSIRMPQSVNTILVDGAVAGCWRWRAGRKDTAGAGGGRIEIEEFEPLDRVTRAEVDAEADRLATALFR